MLRVLVLVAVTACVASGTLQPPLKIEDYKVIPEEVPIVDASRPAAGHTQTAPAITYAVTGSYGDSSSQPGSYADGSSQPGSYMLTENAAGGSYGEYGSNLSYGGRRLLGDLSPAAPARSSGAQTVLVIDVPEDFNPDDNSLTLSFYGEWAHNGSSSFNAAFALELLDSTATEILSFEGPTLHYRSVTANQKGQQQKPYILQYTTGFSDVMLTPGDQAVLRLSTEESFFNDFSARLDLEWQYQSHTEAATPGTYGAYGGEQRGHCFASSTGKRCSTQPGESSTVTTVPKTAMLGVYSGHHQGHKTTSPASNNSTAKPRNGRRRLLEMTATGSYGKEQLRYGQYVASTVGNQPSTEAALGAYGGEQPGYYGSMTEASTPGTYGTYDAAPEYAQLTAIDGTTPEPIVEVQDQLHALNEKYDTGSTVYNTPNTDSDNTQAAMAALLGRRPVPWSYSTATVIGDEPAPAAVSKPATTQTSDVPMQPAVQLAPVGATASTTVLTTAGTAAVVQNYVQPSSPYPLQAVAAVPLPTDAFWTGNTSSGCTTTIPRGLQCGGTRGLCAQQRGASSVVVCKDQAYDDACCASGTVCTRKSEELWLCAPKAPGHSFARRLLA